MNKHISNLNKSVNYTQMQYAHKSVNSEIKHLLKKVAWSNYRHSES